MTDWSTWAQLYYGGAYNVLPDLVRANPGVKVERGVTDDLDIKPGFCSFRLGDPTDLYRPSNAASSLYGQTGPYMKGAFATGGSVQFTGEAQWMNPGETDDHQAVGGTTVRGDRWVDVQLAGPLTRVGYWRDPLASPLFTQIQGAYAATLKLYCPLEDLSGATQLFNVANPNQPGAFSAVTLAGDDGPAGSGKCVKINSGGRLSFPISGMSTTGGYQLAFASINPGVSASNTPIFTWRTTRGDNYYWQANTSGYGLKVISESGSTLLDEAYASGDDAAPGQWIYTRIKITQNGSNIKAEVSWYAEQAENFWGITATAFAGTIGAPTQAAVPANAATNGAAYAHVFGVTGVADDLEDGDFTDAFRGYDRETAVARFVRLCGSRGLPWQWIGDTSSDSRRMGPQQLVTFLDQLKEIRRTESGLIFDRGDNIGITLVTRQYLYRHATEPVLELTYPDDVAGGMAEVTSGADLYNLITAKNVTGSQSIAELATGRYGTQNPPTGSGRLDKTVDVNLASDGPLEDVSSWWLAFYTQEGPRFDTVVVDVDAHPELATACNSAGPGQFITITGRTPDPLLLLITKKSQATHRKRNVFTFSVAPGAIFNVGIYDDAGSVYDSATSTLGADLTTTATSASVKTTNYHDRWDTAAGYDVELAGERCTVTAMTAATFSGGTWNQTATLTRSVNGVVKTQSTGTRFRLADPVYYG